MLSNGTPGHKRTASTVLKSIVTPRNSKAEVGSAQLAPLGELHHNIERPNPCPHTRGLSQQAMDRGRLFHRKSKPDLKSSGQDRAQLSSKSKSVSPKKSKSSTNLAGLLGKGKSKQNVEDQKELKDKENEPPKTVDPIRPPIWAQFSSQDVIERTEIGLNNSQILEKEGQKYTPRDYSPSKSRSFAETPALTRPQGIKVPLKAAAAENAEPSATNYYGLLRKSSSSKSIKDRAGEVPSRGRDSRPVSRPPTSDESTTKSAGTIRGQSRVRAAVAAFSGRNKEAVSTAQPVKTGPSDIEKEFEEMLEARNIAPEVREKMRALDKTIKADLIKQNNATPLELGSAGSRTSSRPGARSRTNTTESAASTTPETIDSAEKKPRPRSFTGFTLGRGAASPKKQKTSKPSTHSRGKSAELPRSSSTTSLVSVASTSSFSLFGKTPKLAVPDDFISYLKTHTKPQNVEVGKIQKLRQLLRNETVTWVDEFINEGGMVELVNLVYRIINIEWREEHEDNLLHHTLTCLKALTTTSAATQQLENLQTKLFPALLALLFSSGEEKKGPAEFTTRGLIISLLFASITACPTAERARILLSFLKDPAPKDATISFIAEMHRPRPYKLWSNEISNVSKEVFWIFLHSVNVIEYPAETAQDLPYWVAHFPQSRPPVAAAPYVGSVEWDATIYLATHLDLLNGILASLESVNERNALRQELRDSGFEKIMGGTLRLCKEKFYGHVHAGLSTWAGAAKADGWDSKDVREGPPRDTSKRTRSASPKKVDKAPVLAMPKLDFQDYGPLSPLSPVGVGKANSDLGDWL